MRIIDFLDKGFYLYSFYGNKLSAKGHEIIF